MPEEETIKRARKDKRQGKAPSTQAGEFVREEFHHIRKGKHGARSSKQAIAIGLSKARRAGVKLAPPAPGHSSPKVRRQAERDYKKGQKNPGHTASALRGRIVFAILKHEGRGSASTAAISRQVRAAARRKTASERSVSARKAVRTKGSARLSAAGKKAARTRRG
ncbi:MAG TPA: DUF6496 domain-containing protein [Verrucomicrobiae bacterium]|jgi:hypothetical protein